MELQHITKNQWVGRVAAFKMIILPKLLYAFRILPIPIQPTFFHQLMSMIRSYIWAEKKQSVQLLDNFEV